MWGHYSCLISTGSGRKSFHLSPGGGCKEDLLNQNISSCSGHSPPWPWKMQGTGQEAGLWLLCPITVLPLVVLYTDQGFIPTEIGIEPGMNLACCLKDSHSNLILCTYSVLVIHRFKSLSRAGWALLQNFLLKILLTVLMKEYDWMILESLHTRTPLSTYRMNFKGQDSVFIRLQ